MNEIKIIILKYSFHSLGSFHGPKLNDSDREALLEAKEKVLLY